MYGASNGEVMVVIQNISEENLEDITVYAATYGEGNTLTQVHSKTIDLDAGESLGVELSVGDNYKVFIWDKNKAPMYNTLTEN